MGASTEAVDATTAKPQQGPAEHVLTQYLIIGGLGVTAVAGVTLFWLRRRPAS